MEINDPASFEQAISAAKFGKFNILLLCVAAPSAWSILMATATQSFVLPVAQCDLGLTLRLKGILNAMCYLGMITTAPLCGYLADTIGRKKLLVYGFFCDFFCVILTGLTQNLKVVMIGKFLNGVATNGPFAALTSVISEYHSARHRSRMLMVMGILYSVGNAVLPALSWAILPRDINIKFIYFEWHSWNIYFFACALISLISCIGHTYIPESPKFLMTTGKNEEALAVLKKMYSMNTGSSADTYPVTQLVDEIAMKELDRKHGGHVTSNRSTKTALKEGFQQMKPLCFDPLRTRLILVCVAQIGIMMALNTLRLWLPQILTAVNDYQKKFAKVTWLCTMLDQARDTKSEMGTSECKTNMDNSSVYKNFLIVASICVLGYTFAALIINRLGKTRLIIITGTCCGVMTVCLYFSASVAAIIICAALYHSCAGVCTNANLAFTAELFPTEHRSMTIALLMMMGRIGTVTGNILFPFLLEIGCAPPFIQIGVSAVFAAWLVIFVPKGDTSTFQ